MIVVKRFTGVWCSPCKQLAPLFEQLPLEYPNVTFQTIDVDSNKETTQKYNITSIPAVVIEENGKLIQHIVGIQSKTTYTNIINSLIK